MKSWAKIRGILSAGIGGAGRMTGLLTTRLTRKRSGVDSIPSLAEGVNWDAMPEWFREAHRKATEALVSETDLREVARRLSASRSTIRSLWKTVLCLIAQVDPGLDEADISDDIPLILEIDDTGRAWIISREYTHDAVINAGFGALADGVSVLLDTGHGKPVGAAMHEDSLRPLGNGKRIEIRITCARETDSDD